MLSDTTENVTISEDKDITIDLNGYILKSAGSGSLITNNGTLTLQDSNTASEHYFTYSASGAWVLDTATPVASDSVIIINLADFILIYNA